MSLAIPRGQIVISSVVDMHKPQTAESVKAAINKLRESIVKTKAAKAASAAAVTATPKVETKPRSFATISTSKVTFKH